ncbi:Xylulose kinase (EC 2.7.1.17) [Mycetohabitans rhizoxinica HKI 454]|uniref:Xylulose kinase n=1 Tax=Mycetohabitans rhizoxinica (strain DSM 19002 / CIP 109453 / HKI 454) TaxID=882378 RepID=E5AKV4_MYCRK|nr:Xylulose kinase (EC 2.7.1.17) [Mycetohabitans rhizoxinica HKI 454]
MSRKADSTVGCEIDTRRQISADVTGYPVITIELEVEAALGAAWLTGLGAGGYATTQSAAGPGCASAPCWTPRGMRTMLSCLTYTNRCACH